MTRVKRPALPLGWVTSPEESASPEYKMKNAKLDKYKIHKYKQAGVNRIQITRVKKYRK